MDQNLQGMTALPAPAPPMPAPKASVGSSLDRLRVKLFLAIAAANAVLAVAAYLVFSWTYDRGFIDYLNRVDQARLDAMVVALAESYGTEAGWAPLIGDRQKWIAFVRAGLGMGSTSRASGTEAERPADPQREFPLTIDPRLLLFDAERKLLIGRPEQQAQAVLRPIAWQERVVGYLGYVPRPHFVESINRVFSQQQHHKFAAVALGMLGAGLLLGAGLAYWLAKRIRAVARGTAALIQGDYDVRLEAQGHDELDQLTRHFNELAATLGATRRARQQWIADIAHELRTPLAVLRAEIEALQDGVRPVGAESLGSLAQEIGRLGRLVEDLHLLSLSDLGALSYHKAAVDVGDLIEEVVATYGRALAERGLAVETRLQAGIGVLADETRLAQIFGNLLQNTLRYTDAGGRLAIALRREGARAVIDWQDSSPGVPHEDLPRLTDRLFRVDGSRSRAGGGTGLGLAIVKAIVDAHDGTMTARRSTLGGLWWEISLPLVAPREHHG